MEDGSEYLADYAVMTAEEGYAFRVEQQQGKGKLLRASRSLAAGEELLQEVPLLVWPIAVSLLPPSLFSFCENCMQLKQPAKLSSSGSTTSPCPPHTSSDNRLREEIGDGEEGVFVQLQQGEPPCWFCSLYCRAAALGSSTAGVEVPPLQQQQLPEQQQVEGSSSFTYTARSRRKRKASSSEAPAFEAGDEVCAGADCGVTASTTATEADADAAGGNQDMYGMDTEGRKAVENPVSNVSHHSQQDGQLLGGWLWILRPSLLRRLRSKEQFACPANGVGPTARAAAAPTADGSAPAGEAAAAAEVHQPRSMYADPLPTEALARAIARIAAQTRALEATVGLPVLHAYNAACRPFMRLAQQQQQRMPTTEQQQLLRDLLLLPLQEAVGAEIAEALLSAECLQQLYAALAVNSQALNVWGAAASTGQFMLLRAGGVYTLHACMNHSCEPNCRVSIGAATSPRQQQPQNIPAGKTSVAAAAVQPEGHSTGVMGGRAEAAAQQAGGSTSAAEQQQYSAAGEEQQQEESRSNGRSAAAGGGGSLLSIETTRPVRAGDELCVSYIDTALQFEQRQQLLWDTYGFHCDCPRCRRGL